MSIRSKFTYDELYPRKGKDIKPVTKNKLKDLVSDKKYSFVKYYAANHTSKAGNKTRTSPHDMKALKGLMEYLSRDGMDLYNERGKAYTNAQIDKALVSWPYIPKENGTQREAIHLVLSAHIGDDREAVIDAVNSIAKPLFEGHKYYIAHHNNTERQHAHVVIKSLDIGGLNRFHPFKQKTIETTEMFNQALIDRGLDYTNMTKQDRLSSRRYITPHAYSYFNEHQPKLLKQILHNHKEKSIDERSKSYYHIAEKLMEGNDKDQDLAGKLIRFTDSKQRQHTREMKEIDRDMREEFPTK